MAPLLRVLALMGLLCGCMAASPCDGPAAKLRYQFLYKLKPGTKAADVEAAAKQWMEGCKAAGLVRYGLGPAATTNLADFGNPSGTIADFAVWSDWNSLADIKKCQELSLKSGIAQKTRAFAEKAARVVYELPATGGGNLKPAKACASALSTAPATVRYLWAFTLNGGPTAENCAKATTNADRVIELNPAEWVRRAQGCDVVANDTAFYAPNIKNTADVGGSIDFLGVPNMRTLLFSSSSPAALAARNVLRATASDTMRAAIWLPADAPAAATAKPAAAAAGPTAAAKPK